MRLAVKLSLLLAGATTFPLLLATAIGGVASLVALGPLAGAAANKAESEQGIDWKKER